MTLASHIESKYRKRVSKFHSLFNTSTSGNVNAHKTKENNSSNNNANNNNVEISNISYKKMYYRGVPLLSFIKRNSWVSLNLKRAPQIVLKFSCSGYIGKSEQEEPPVNIIISPKKEKNTFLIKFIGSRETWKVLFACQLLHEFICNMHYRMMSEQHHKHIQIKSGPLKIVNIVLKWDVSHKKIPDFDIIKREAKNLVKFYVSKFPQLIFTSAKVFPSKHYLKGLMSANLRTDHYDNDDDGENNNNEYMNNNNTKISSNVSYQGICTSSKSSKLSKIHSIRQYVPFIIDLINDNNDSKFGESHNEQNNYLGKCKFEKEIEQTNHERAQWLNCFHTEKDTNLTRYFLISKVKLKKLRFKTFLSSKYIPKLGFYCSLDFFKQNIDNLIQLYGWQPEVIVEMHGLRMKPFTWEEINEE